MAYFLEYLAWLCALAAVLYGSGRCVVRWLGRPLPAGLEGMAHWTYGLGLWIAIAFGLSTAGQLNRGAVGLVLLVLSALGLRQGLAAWRARTAGKRPPMPSWASPAHLLFGLLAAGILAPWLLLTLRPTVSWDADVYHLALPRRYIQGGGFQPAPFLVYRHWPHNTELLYALAILAKDYVLAKALHFGFGLLVMWAAYGACRRAGAGAWSGALAAILIFIHPVFALEMQIAYVDLAYAFFFLVAFLSLSHAGEAIEAGRDSRAPLRLAGLASGLLIGVKVSGIVGACVLGLLLVLPLWKARKEARLKPALRAVLTSFCLPAVVFALPWSLLAAWETGNPIYPLAHGVFGGPHWSATIDAQLKTWLGSMGMGRDPLDYLLLPVRVILKGAPGFENFSGSLSELWIVLLPLALLLIRSYVGPRRLAKRALAVSGVYFCAWAMMSQQMRFLIPILPLLAISISLGVQALVERLPVPLRAAAAGAAFTAILSAMLMTHEQDLRSGYAHLKQYRSRTPEALQSRVVPKVFAHINRELPENAKLLMLNTNRSFFCEREAVVDSFFQAPQIVEWLADCGDVTTLVQRLREAGLTHLLWAEADWEIPWPKALDELLQDGESTRLVFQDLSEKMRLYRLR